ncbi:MAG: Rrf2 family transcriptional regulator [Fibrobacteres bacterium]|nr:Rrf2 family transcriptional regulator [Fibrobacterota bacterium]
MSSYGRTSSNAIAIASLLAERWTAKTRTTSQEASKIRGISKPLAARILVQLAQMGLVEGTPGPHGGYILSRPPREIRLSEIVSVFQRVESDERCAYGPGWCGNGNPCPLHDELTRLESEHLAFLERTTLNVFVGKTPLMGTPGIAETPTSAGAKRGSKIPQSIKPS